MTRTESALNTLAEVATTELSQKIDPNGFTEQKSVAKRGGHVAATARHELEKQLGLWSQRIMPKPCMIQRL